MKCTWQPLGVVMLANAAATAPTSSRCSNTDDENTRSTGLPPALAYSSTEPAVTVIHEGSGATRSPSRRRKGDPAAAARRFARRIGAAYGSQRTRCPAPRRSRPPPPPNTPPQPPTPTPQDPPPRAVDPPAKGSEGLQIARRRLPRHAGLEAGFNAKPPTQHPSHQGGRRDAARRPEEKVVKRDHRSRVSGTDRYAPELRSQPSLEPLTELRSRPRRPNRRRIERLASAASDAKAKRSLR